MRLKIAGQWKKVELQEGTVKELLYAKKVEMPELVTVQLNGAILNISDYAATRLADGDELEFLYFMGGGSGGAAGNVLALRRLPAAIENGKVRRKYVEGNTEIVAGVTK